MSTINVNVRVQNNFPQTASSVTLYHQFSSDPVQQNTWNNVSGNGGQSAYWTVQGNTSSGHDYWKIVVTLSDNTIWEHTSSWKTCTIESSDNNSYQTQVVSPNFWSIPLNSGGCTTWLESPAGATADDAAREPENKKAAGTTQGDPVPAGR
jgi:hypothetical protein